MNQLNEPWQLKPLGEGVFPAMISHPPEPWTCVRYGNVEYRNATDVSIDHSGSGTVIDGIDQYTAARIAACVNFCKHFPTEWLSGFKDGADAVALVQAQSMVPRRKLSITTTPADSPEDSE